MRQSQYDPAQAPEGLAFIAELKMDKSRVGRLRSMLGGSTGPGATVDFAADQSIFAGLCGPEHSRIDIRGRSAFGTNFSVILRQDGTTTFLDHNDLCFFHADADQTPGWKPGPSGKTEVTLADGPAFEGRATRLATLHVRGAMNATIVVTLMIDEQLARFSRRVFHTMLGCTKLMEEAGVPIERLASLGIPVKIESFESERGSTPLTSVALSGFSLRKLAGDEFVPGAEYADLRDPGFRDRLSKSRDDLTGFNRDLSSLRAGRSADRMNDNGYRNGTRAPSGGVSAGTVGTSRQALDSDKVNGLNVPQCLPATFGSVITMETAQLLADDIQFFVNAATKRLSGFTGTGGNIAFDWLDQWAMSPGVTGGTDGLFDLVRNDPALTPGTHPGLLDSLAERQASGAMADGTLPTKISLPAPVLTRVNSIIGSTPPNDRFNALTQADRDFIREAFLQQRLARFNLTYPSSTPTQQLFYGLMNFKLTGIDFDIRINNTAVMTRFDLDNGAIRMDFALPESSGKAWMLRWPTLRYWFVLGLSGIACFFFPFLCSLAAAVALVGAFLLADAAFVTLDLTGITLATVTTFAPDSAGLLRPSVACTLNASVSFSYISVVPTGVHQILSLIYTIIGNTTSIIVDTLESELQDRLNGLLHDTLNLTFPPKFGEAPLVAIGATAAGILRDHLLLQTSLDGGAVPISPPYITQVDPNPSVGLLARRSQHTFDRPYAGVALSQNFINQYVNSLWRAGAFTYQFSSPELTQIVDSLRHGLRTDRVKCVSSGAIWPAVTPRTVFTPRGLAEQGFYATTFFDDMRLCLVCRQDEHAREGSRLELQFAAQATTQVGFGAKDDSGMLSVLRVGDRFMDIYFDLGGFGVKLIHPEVDNGLGTGSLAPLGDPARLAGAEAAMELAMRFALATRDDKQVPVDPASKFIHHYAIPAGSIDFQMEVARGILFAWIGLNGTVIDVPLLGTFKGIVELFPGGRLDIDTLTPLMGGILREAIST